MQVGVEEGHCCDGEREAAALQQPLQLTRTQREAQTELRLCGLTGPLRHHPLLPAPAAARAIRRAATAVILMTPIA